MTKFIINPDMSPQDISRYLTSWVRAASQLSLRLKENPNQLAPQKVEQFLNKHLDPILAYFFNTPEGKQHLTPPSNGKRSWQDILNRQLQEILKTYQDAYLFVLQKNLEGYEQKISSVVADSTRDPNDFRSMILGRQVQVPYVLDKLKESKQLSDETREKAAHLLEEHIARLKDIDPLPPRASLEKILTKEPLFDGPTRQEEYYHIKNTAALFMERVMAGKTRPSDLEQDAQTYLLAPMIAISKDLKQRYNSNEELELPSDLNSLDGIEGIEGHHMISELDKMDFQNIPKNASRFNLLKDLHQKYDSLLTATLPDSRKELEEAFVTRLKTWVGTQRDFFATARNLVNKITQKQPDLIGKYFPSPPEDHENLGPDASAADPEATVLEADYVAPSPETEKSEKTFGSIRRLVQKGFTSVINFGKTLVNTMKPAAKTLATAATALAGLVVGLMSPHMGPSAPSAPEHTRTAKFAAAAATPVPAIAVPEPVAIAVGEPAAASSSAPQALPTHKKPHTLKTVFAAPPAQSKVVIEEQEMRFGKETYRNACAQFSSLGIQSWVCRHFAIN